MSRIPPLSYEQVHKHGIPVIVDNTVLTPALFQPFEHGVDIAVYSTTKFLGGHGVHIGGAIVDSGNFQWAENPAKWPECNAPDPSYHGVILTGALEPVGNIAYIIHARTHWLRDTGGAMSPFAAFLFLGLETLHVRLERHVEPSTCLAVEPKSQFVASVGAEIPLKREASVRTRAE